MNTMLERLLNDALDAAHKGESGGESLSLLVLLLTRYRNRRNPSAMAADDELIRGWFGDLAAGTRVTRRDVRDVVETTLARLDRLPLRNAVVVSIVSAPGDAQSIPAVLAVMGQFVAPLSAEDEQLLTSLMIAIIDHGSDTRVIEAVEGWATDTGDVGDAARTVLGRGRNVRRRWRSLDALVSDAARAVPAGWPLARPITALRLLLDREAARQRGEDADAEDLTHWLAEFGRRVPTFHVSPERAGVIARRIWNSAPDDSATVAPLTRLLVPMASGDTVPLLLELLERNRCRHGTGAAADADQIMAALRPFAHRDDVLKALSEHGEP